MRLDLPGEKKHVFDMVLPIRWGDMDAMGHVNNTVYFRYMETVRLEWMFNIGIAPDPQGQGPVILNAFCNFYKQLSYPGDVLVKLFVSEPKRSTFETWCTLELAAQPDAIHAAGGATVVWVDFPKQKSADLPPWLLGVVT
ncbi:acyl-CoA thioester hydrolase, YbgC/YbaW family [Betaproteobacteria bacterium MOLA814]|nr:acyl-CoA thioester hydrolase, YbgC/YbaW family [Betaproteobacteria bacterium MOLA814]